jgi:hypothetical protein
MKIVTPQCSLLFVKGGAGESRRAKHMDFGESAFGFCWGLLMRPLVPYATGDYRILSLRI